MSNDNGLTAPATPVFIDTEQVHTQETGYVTAESSESYENNIQDAIIKELQRCLCPS